MNIFKFLKDFMYMKSRSNIIFWWRLIWIQGIVSGLNRGLSANQDDLGKADDAAKELETVAGTVDLLTDLDKLQGRWKLIYSSAFSSRTLGGSRPGLPTGRLLPVTLGQVCSKFYCCHNFYIRNVSMYGTFISDIYLLFRVLAGFSENWCRKQRFW